MSNIGDNKNTRCVVWWVYMVRCNDGTLYTGCTTDPARRLRQHNGKSKGGAKYTMTRRPVEPAGLERVTGLRSEALKRENALKRLTRMQKLQWCATNKWVKFD
jgi:putative endonuclease